MGFRAVGLFAPVKTPPSGIHRAYLAAHEDEGNGWHRLGETLTKLLDGIS